MVNSGGTESVFDGGTAIDTTVNAGGTENLALNGTSSGTTVNGGGTETVYGLAQSSVINNGGMQFVYAGGNVSEGHVSSGGSLTISGGTAAISAEAGATVTFAGPGELITNQPDFAAVISGFGASDLIDLANFQYSPGTQVSFKNGALTLTHGKAQPQLTLAGSYAARNFELSSDGSGGTLIAFRQPPGQV